MSQKFISPLAEELYSLTLDSSQDDQAGDAVSGNGWYALFLEEKAILAVDPMGFVGVAVLESEVDVKKAWNNIVTEATYGHLDESCDGLFLILSTARHLSIVPDYDDVREHIDTCPECAELGNFLED